MASERERRAAEAARQERIARKAEASENTNEKISKATSSTAAYLTESLSQSIEADSDNEKQDLLSKKETTEQNSDGIFLALLALLALVITIKYASRNEFAKFLILLILFVVAVNLFGFILSLGIVAIYAFIQHYISNAREKTNLLQALKEKYQEELNVQTIAEKHSEALARKRRRLIVQDDYGNIDDIKWKSEVFYFISKVVNPDFLIQGLNQCVRLKQNEIFELIDDIAKKSESTELNDFDPKIDPIDYEHFCADLLRRCGWDAHTTKATGDQGVDVVASKNSYKGAIQCKRYSSSVGNKAVQEVYAGMRYIGGNFCAVVTNADYTRSAKELARTLGVLLLHHDDLKLLEEKIAR